MNVQVIDDEFDNSRTLSSNDIIQLQSYPYHLPVGHEVFSIWNNNWGGGYSEYRRAIIKAYNEQNQEYLMEFKYAMGNNNYIKLRLWDNVEIDCGTYGRHFIPSFIVPNFIEPTAPSSKKRKLAQRNWFQLIHKHHANNRIIFYLSSFLSQYQYMAFKAVSKSIYKAFNHTESIIELSLHNKPILNYQLINRRLIKCKYLKSLKLNAFDLGDNKIKIPSSVIRLQLFGKHCPKWLSNVHEYRTNIIYLILSDFGTRQFPLWWPYIPEFFLNNVQYLYLSNCCFHDFPFSNAKYDLNLYFQHGLRGFSNLSNNGFNHHFVMKVIQQYGSKLEYLGCSASDLNETSLWNDVKFNNLLQFHIASPRNSSILRRIISSAPLLEKVGIQDCGRLTRHRMEINKFMEYIFKIPNLTEVRIVEAMPMVYAINDSLRYALYHSNCIRSKCIKLKFMLFASKSFPCIDLRQMYLNCESLSQMVSTVYGKNGFFLLFEYREFDKRDITHSPSSTNLSGIKEIINEHKIKPNVIEERLNNYSVKSKWIKNRKIVFEILPKQKSDWIHLLCDWIFSA